jgi:hypothetical protein
MATHYGPWHPYTQQHDNGVHVNCRPAHDKNVGSGSPARCAYAGGVERVHSHDYDGPLVCGCEELGAA